MRKQIIAGNWKMNGTLSETGELIKNLKNKLGERDLQRTVVLCPPFTSLTAAKELIHGTPFRLGAQNLHFESAGAYTGEISAAMLLGAGCEYVIVGHSERREYFHETDSRINKKVKKALGEGLLPIVCVGETLEQREDGVTNDIVKLQLFGALADVADNELEKVVLAYEPVWAIGTGKTATPEQANEVHAYLRSLIAKKYSPAAADGIVIQYGGSVKADNAKDLLTMPDIDGALVGGASLDAESFSAIVEA
jgi:triosephosphate isomerase (TIM)